MNIEKTKEKLEELSDQFDSLYDKTVEDIDIENMTLKNALKSQVKLQVQWERLFSHVNYLYNTIQEETENTFSQCVSNELKDSYKDVTISEAKEHAKSNTDYRNKKKLEIKSKSLLDEVKSVLEIINSRKYILNNLTTSLTHGTDGHII